jgi:RNA polymerase sigma factor (sigma-70 family)
MSEAVAPSSTAGGSSAGLTRVLSDERLARRAIKGDERAFAAIFDRYHQRLYRYCVTIVGNAEDAQDALQNTMVKVLRALPGEERRIELKPWLYRIAHNESVELLRRRRETRELDPGLPAPGGGLAAEAASRERLRQLLSDLDQLPERQRGVLVMRELAGLEFAEIGTALGTSPAVARQTLYEARLGLRQMDEGREMNCAEVTKALSDGDGRVGRRRDLRAHLRACSGCQRFGEEIESRQRDLAALSPLPAIAAAGLLQGLLGGGAGTGAGGGLMVAAGGGAAKTAGASLALKGAATVAVVAAIGVGAADRGGLIDAGLPGGGGSAATGTRPPAGAEPTGASALPAAAGAARPVDVGSSARAGDGGVGRAEAVKPVDAAAGRPPAASETNAAADAAPTSPSQAGAPPRGKGHEKQLPAAAAHGQQTAATHKNSSPGSSGAKGHPAKPSHPATPAHPAKPTHPAHPSTPSAGKAPAAPPPATAAPPPKSQGNVPPPAGGEAPAAAEAGKKP